MKKRIATALGILLTVQAFSADIVELKSDVGDYIGSGTNTTLNDPFKNIEFSKKKISFEHSSGYRFEFVAPNNRNLEPGIYAQAERAPFRGPFNPGMSVNSSGRGCNTISGEFYIYEYDVANAKLAMDFIQFCDSVETKLAGEIRINSDVEFDYTEPLFNVTTEKVRPRASETIEFSVSNALVTYLPYSVSWEQTEGPDIAFDQSTGVSVNATMPAEVKLGGEQVTVKATLTDNIGNTAQWSHSFTVISKSDPFTGLVFSSEAGDYIGQGLNWDYDEGNAEFTISSNYHNGVTVNIQGSEHWWVNFASPGKAVLEPLNYPNATRFPFQESNEAGFNISGDGRGCNRLFGEFEIKQLRYIDEVPSQLHATFEQHCENMDASVLTGEIWVNALPAGVPSADAGVTQTLSEGRIVNLNGSKTTDPDGQALTYRWSSADEDINVSNDSFQRAYAVLPLLGDRVNSRQVEFELFVEDTDGFQSKDIVLVVVTENNSAPYAVEDVFETTFEEKITIQPLLNDTDLDGAIQTNTIVIVEPPQYGDVIVLTNGELTYIPDTGSNLISEDFFTYTVEDNDGDMSAVTKISLNRPSVTLPETPKVENPETDTSSSSPAGSVSILLLLLSLVLCCKRNDSILANDFK